MPPDWPTWQCWRTSSRRQRSASCPGLWPGSTARRGVPPSDVGNGPAYLSRSFAKDCKALDLKHIRNRPYMPCTNGKAERFIQTLFKNKSMRWPSRTAWNATTGCRDTSRSITGSGSTQLSPTDPLSSGSRSCSSDQRGETQHLHTQKNRKAE